MIKIINYLATFFILLNLSACSRDDGLIEFPATTLTIGHNTLALSVKDAGLSAQLTGTPRTLTITNSGNNTAFFVKYTLSRALPAGTTVTPSNCGDLTPEESCTITIKPGATASAVAGDTDPEPIVLTVTGENTNSANVDIHILTYGSVYQGGYVFAIDDTTATTGSVGGKVIALNDQATGAAGLIWSSDGNGSASADAVFDDLAGIYENSANPPDACDGNTDGECNSDVITTFYNAINTNLYAAGLCQATISGRSDWYLPAICELGYDTLTTGSGCGTSLAPTLDNVQSNLVDNSNIGSLTGNYWSSTEESIDPDNEVWVQNFATAGASTQSGTNKGTELAVRCVRAMTL